MGSHSSQGHAMYNKNTYYRLLHLSPAYVIAAHSNLDLGYLEKPFLIGNSLSLYLGV